ncbi:hypothetical protein U1Q18_038659 [Sarracenia purpurea var. burkii]
MTIASGKSSTATAPSTSPAFRISTCCRIVRRCRTSFRVTRLMSDAVHGSGFDVAVFGEEDGNLRLGLERCETDTVASVELHGGDKVGDYVDLLRRGFALAWVLDVLIFKGGTVIF